ncbi:MAG TPA: hypothetical protein VIG50_20135 [Vicinamibacteria bacterium]
MGPLAYLPARWPPLLYFGFAHACLALAFAVAAVRPAEIAGGRGRGAMWLPS